MDKKIQSITGKLAKIVSGDPGLAWSRIRILDKLMYQGRILKNKLTD